MQNLPFFDDLELQLRKCLPATYVRRVLDELKAHVDDAAADAADCHDATDCHDAPSTLEPSEVLGSAEALVDGIVTSFRQQHPAGRHPLPALLAVTLLSTPLLLILSAVACIFTVTDLLPLVGVELLNPDLPWTTGYIVCGVGFRLSVFFPFVGSAVLMCRTWERSGRGVWWLGTALSLQLLIAAVTVGQLNLTGEQPCATLQFRAAAISAAPEIEQSLGQIAVPLVVAAAAVLRQRRSTNKPILQ
ncbi:MAG: hypothetical protein KDA89_13820 [Planctomycetaceae bacterium]|nr:hypothetical protein [Planctomycetaceae bacterium]